MNYIQSEIDQILDQIDLYHLITGENDLNNPLAIVTISDSSNKEYKIVIDSETQTYFCIDDKTIAGNAVNYVMWKYHLTFPLAIKFLTNMVEKSISYKNEISDSIPKRMRFREICNAMMDYYKKNMKIKNNPAMVYALKRGLNTNTITNFQLGYSGTFGSGLYDFLLKKGFSAEELVDNRILGKNKQGEIYDKFYDRLMFPIFDENGLVIGFGGRTLKDSDAKYINSIENELFHKGENLYGFHIAKKTSKSFLILCEGNIDVIAMHQAGYINSAASLGTSLTFKQCELISKRFKNVVLAYDNDKAGKKAAYRAIRLLKFYGTNVNVLDLSPYKDPDEFIKNLGVDSFTQRVLHSNTSSTFLKNYIRELEIDEKAEKIQEILEEKYVPT